MPLLAAGLILALSPSLRAEESCMRGDCPTHVRFTSHSESRSYGLLITAPDDGCRRVRFRVEVRGRRVGQTPALGPGERAVVGIGRGFPEGLTEVVVVAVGCRAAPAAIRRVTLAKVSPDHGWRAAGG